MEKKYQVTGIAIGGRNGNVYTSDNQFKTKLSFPKELGGDGSSINPEQLFASGYAGCFSQAALVVAQQLGIDSSKAPQVEVTVQLYIDQATGFHIKVGIEGVFKDWDQKQAEEFMIKCHKTCPYSKLIKDENLLYVKANGVIVKI
ncbi:Ohr family peroxiredoxin [Malacoplasma iowae]|uniref:Ohr family peroxiredoxin n=1 Tax=Malacoplasma iowae TaxID=2116 RepID=UPI0038734EAC|nr:Ohr family peroxiredoxin [Malacoplasma iowae]